MSRTKITRISLYKSYEKLISLAELDLSFIVLTLGAAAICSFGFRMNSSAVIIGAMVLSPLLYSVVSVGVASFKKDWKILIRGIITLIIGLIVAIGISIAINLIFSTYAYTDSEIVTRFGATPLNYFFVAFFSGLVGTFAFFWPGDLEKIVGIAISVALIPPVVLTGLGIANLDYQFFMRSLIIVLTNIVGIYLGSFLMFVGLHFLSKRSE